MNKEEGARGRVIGNRNHRDNCGTVGDRGGSLVMLALKEFWLLL